MKKIKIRVENLHKTFREEEVLKGITCDFEAGKTHAIVVIMDQEKASCSNVSVDL